METAHPSGVRRFALQCTALNSRKQRDGSTGSPATIASDFIASSSGTAPVCSTSWRTSVEVDAATVELCLPNDLSNAIKYSDPEKPERWVEVTGELTFGNRIRQSSITWRATDKMMAALRQPNDMLVEDPPP